MKTLIIAMIVLFAVAYAANPKNLLNNKCSAKSLALNNQVTSTT